MFPEPSSNLQCPTNSAEALPAILSNNTKQAKQINFLDIINLLHKRDLKYIRPITILTLITFIFMSAQDIFLRFEASSFLQKLSIRKVKNFSPKHTTSAVLAVFLLLCVFWKILKKTTELTPAGNIKIHRPNSSYLYQITPLLVKKNL
jgi:hypothetical protein